MKVITYIGLLAQSCCGEGGTLQRNITGMCEECSQCLGCTGFAPAHDVCAFLVYTAQAPGCSTGNCPKPALGFVHFPGLNHSGLGSRILYKGKDSVGLAFCAISRSKLLRFRFLGTLQRHRLGWACVLCLSQVQEAQTTRLLASTLSQVGHSS